MKFRKWPSMVRDGYGHLAHVLKRSRESWHGWFGQKWEAIRVLLAMNIGELVERSIRQIREAGNARTQFRNITIWPQWFRVALLCLVFALTLGISAAKLWGDLSDESRVLTNELLIQKSRFQHMAFEEALLQTRLDRIATIEDRFGQMLEMIPAELEVVHVLDQVNKVARESGMKLQSFRPDPEIIEEAYATLPVNIELSGSFDAIGLFLEAVSRLQHLVTIDILLESKDAIPGKLYLTARLKAYRGDLPKKIGNHEVSLGGSSVPN
jgi:type IV pilus assembly protein PilO